ncbi:unnamed protein product [Diamesa tonsa]
MQNKSETQEPNVPCQNCKRSSNLKCIWCDTIYCSVKCQFEDWNEHKDICLKSKGIVSELVISDHVKQPGKPFISHIARDLNNMRLKRLASAETNNKVALCKAEALKRSKISAANAEALKKPTHSVQERLKVASTRDSKVQSVSTKAIDDYEYSLKLDKPMKKEIKSPITFKKEVRSPIAVKKVIRSPITFKKEKIEIMDDVDVKSEEVSVTLVPNRIIELANKVQGNRKWKQYEIPTQVDEDGFFKATITDYGIPKLGMQSYVVSPLGLKDQCVAHLRQLQQVYKSTTFEPLPVDKIKRHDLVVALFGITWNRAIVLEVTDTMICVRSIEHGTNCFIKDFSKIKAPLPAELQKKSFIIEVIFENENEVDGIDINSVVSMKMMSEMSGTNLATLKTINKIVDDCDASLDDELFERFEKISISTTVTDGPFREEVVRKVEVTTYDEKIIKTKSLDERKYLSRQMVKDFHTGDNIKLTFLDGSQLQNGRAHFCEYLPENVEFYMKIDKEIKDYIANNVDEGNYTPANNELVLAKYNDGLYYRGVCESIKDGIALIYFLDYGGSEHVEIEDIFKIPSNLLYTICAHTCRVKFSEVDLSTVNIEVTVNQLFDEQHIACKVEKLKSDEYPYQLTIDKSLAVINKIYFSE